MLLVDDILISDLVIESKFTCDLNACKGCCCQIGDRGSPLQRSEIEKITKIKDQLLKLMSDNRKELLLESNFFLKDGSHIELQCLPQGECVFSYEAWPNDNSNDNGNSGINNNENRKTNHCDKHQPILKCLIEKLWFEGKSEFRKPLFCHLFPLVIDNFYNRKCINMEIRPECSDAVGNGQLVVESCKDALLRVFSKEWYDKMLKEIKNGGKVR